MGCLPAQWLQEKGHFGGFPPAFCRALYKTFRKVARDLKVRLVFESLKTELLNNLLILVLHRGLKIH